MGSRGFLPLWLLGGGFRMKQKMNGIKRRNMVGWLFLMPATLLIFDTGFYTFF